MGEIYTGTPGTGTPPTGPGTAGPPGGTEGSAHFTAALLQASLSAARVQGMVSLLWQGPQVNAFAVVLALGEDPAKVERLAGALALAAGVDACRVARDGGRLILELPKPPAERQPLRAGRLEEFTPDTPTTVALGLATGGRVTWLDIAAATSPHLLIAGTTGSGKSVALRWLVYRLVRQNSPANLRVLLLDPKRGELAAFGRLPHLLHPIASSPLEMAQLLAWAVAELDRRLDGGRRPRLLLVVEELADLAKTVPTAMGDLARIAQVGRGLGVHLVGVTQQPGAKVLGEALANFPARLLGRVASATLTYGAAGRARTGADGLLGNGDMLLLTNEGTTRLQIPLLDDRRLLALPRVAAEVARLDDELPALALLADLHRDRRGGSGRRELGEEDYAAMGADLASGASADDLRARYGVGYTRARRIVDTWREKGR